MLIANVNKDILEIINMNDSESESSINSEGDNSG